VNANKPVASAAWHQPYQRHNNVHTGSNGAQETKTRRYPGANVLLRLQGVVYLLKCRVASSVEPAR